MIRIRKKPAGGIPGRLFICDPSQGNRPPAIPNGIGEGGMCKRDCDLYRRRRIILGM